jgi:hypothetical protein
MEVAMVIVGPRPKTKTPEWLRPMWEKKNADMEVRISTGMEVLRERNRPVTLAAIQQAILAASNVQISRSTIQRSEAYRRDRRRAIRDRPSTSFD